ncbi:MAG: DUF2237 domain-containing protein [Bacteroidetes bacterium SW_10_40_5]|nr:MAG: DUF2237 domain-containing protein [Bacteroidetes bacterium SW_10_40_5]
MARNVFGEELRTCSTEPMTGFYRDGCCKTDEDDIGNHTVCSVMTEEFLEFTKQQGNDLSTPRPQFGFPGLKPGDRWCLCAMRWQEAYYAKAAPKVILEATDEKTLQFIDLHILVQFAVKEESKRE